MNVTQDDSFLLFSIFWKTCPGHTPTKRAGYWIIFARFPWITQCSYIHKMFRLWAIALVSDMLGCRGIDWGGWQSIGWWTKQGKKLIAFVKIWSPKRDKTNKVLQIKVFASILVNKNIIHHHIGLMRKLFCHYKHATGHPSLSDSVSSHLYR